MRQRGTVIHYRQVAQCTACGSIACAVANERVCRHTRREREVTYLSDAPEESQLVVEEAEEVEDVPVEVPEVTQLEDKPVQAKRLKKVRR